MPCERFGKTILTTRSRLSYPGEFVMSRGLYVLADVVSAPPVAGGSRQSIPLLYLILRLLRLHLQRPTGFTLALTNLDG